MTRRRVLPARRRVVGPYPFLDASTPLGFAHRGGAAFGDENTIAAFGRAVAAGYRYIETDTHSTIDGVAVVFHDADLRRVAGDPRSIGSMTYADLATVTQGGEPIVPRLEDVMAAWPDVRFNIDVKSDAAVPATLAVIDRLAAVDRVLVASFDDRRLAEVRASAGPRLATSTGTRETARLWLGSRLRRRFAGFPPGAAAVQVPLERYGLRVIDERFVDHVHEAGLAVHVWTIDDPGMMGALLDLGVDGIMTDEIEILADVYRNRGHWPAR
ncbi:glycerophosphodiester phosphodiesterase family protein [Stackebrandtia soli]|uniref:glycerophosphodiester phosphodiesterase family protein n=1 Tax=Stackebrandtia soli TaxID=1892856 RepID=UPI0039ECCB36